MRRAGYGSEIAIYYSKCYTKLLSAETRWLTVVKLNFPEAIVIREGRDALRERPF
jgi:hypothetical protein